MTLSARVICADPPWAFGDKLPGGGRGAVKHYKVLTLSDIMRFPFGFEVEENAMLVLWRVASQVEEAYQVIRAWGFVPKSEIVWVKTDEKSPTTPEELAMGMGHYTRGSHETAIVATRGSFKVADHGVRSVFFAPRQEHSTKPDAFYALIERLACDDGRLVELFARKARVGWHCYGDELPQGYVWTPRGDRPPPKEPPPCTHRYGRKKLASGQRLCKDCDEPEAMRTCEFCESETSAKMRSCCAKGRMEDNLAVGEAFRKDQETSGNKTGSPSVAHSAESVAATASEPSGAGARTISKPTEPGPGTEVNGYVPPAYAQPGENIGKLGQELDLKGVHISLIDLAEWSGTKRDVARLWLEQGGPRPDFFPSGCAACDRGEPVDGKEYIHTGEGPTCGKKVCAACGGLVGSRGSEAGGRVFCSAKCALAAKVVPAAWVAPGANDAPKEAPKSAEERTVPLPYTY